MSEQERIARFTGAVYAPFIVSKLIDGTLGQELRQTLIRITDGDEVIYDELTSSSADFEPDPVVQKRGAMEV